MKVQMKALTRGPFFSNVLCDINAALALPQKYELYIINSFYIHLISQESELINPFFRHQRSFNTR